MATLLYRLGKTAYRRWPIFLAAWVIALATLGAGAGLLSKPMSNSFSIPGIESVDTAELQQELFPEAEAVDAPTATIVVAAPEGQTLADEPYAGAISTLTQDLGALSDVTEGVVGPVEAAAGLEAQVLAGVDQAQAAAQEAGQPFDRDAALAAAEAQLASATPLSADGRIGTISFAFDEPTVLDVSPEAQDEVLDLMDTARDSGLTVEVSGPGMQVVEQHGASAELIGIAVAIMILALTFGSLVAAGMPLLTARVGLGIGIAGITAGSAVVFAGLTVIIALVALGVVGISFLTAMGLGAAVTVAVAVLVALTLLPAILGLLKSKAFGGSFRHYRPRREADRTIINNGVRWARLLGRAPVVAVVVVVLGLGALAIPAKDMHLALPSDSTASEGTTQREASDLVTEAFGPGRLAPMLVVVDARDLGSDQDRQAAYQAVAAWAGGQDDVTNAMVAVSNENGAMILVEPASAAEDTATEDLLQSLRDGEAQIEYGTGTTVGVTGLTAIQTDVSQKLADALPIYLAIVIGLAFLLLMIVFRSILVPLTATLGFLLSIMATLGATVALFQEGLFGLFPGQPIVSFIPIFLIGVVFGLAMDYQVFLVTRIREAYVHGATYREAVVDGFRNSARVVTAAALIMTAVFAGFIFMDDPIITSMGFALAAAVIFDAFVIRMVLIPALMYLMGDKAWYLPAWLDRILPRVDIEGENLHRPHLTRTSEGSDERVTADV